VSDPQSTLEQVADDAVAEVVGKKEKYSDQYFSRKAVIYFIAAGNDPIKAVKIGVTARNTVSTRLRSIQSANHERIGLLKVSEFLDDNHPGLNAERHEAELHREFASLQRAKAWTVGAEWFNWAEPLIQFIEGLPPLPADLQHLAHPAIAAKVS
jgi:hypothetical protein